MRVRYRQTNVSFKQIDLGTCCHCGKDDISVVNIVMLDKKAPVPGTGWGCMVCGLPNDGAIAVLCNECIENGNQPLMVCHGVLARCGRIEIKMLGEEFRHKPEFHEGFLQIKKSTH